MSTYKEIVGHKIKKVSSDPGEPKTGQIWYNTATGTLRGLGIVSAWASTSPLATARADSAGAGTTSAGLAFGGTPASGVTGATEEYNGTGFFAGGSLNTARRTLGGAGTQTAGLAIAGYTTTNLANVEEYNGTAWSEETDIPTVMWKPGALGIQTAALSIGGIAPPSPSSVGTTFKYDGSSWTSTGALGTARYGTTGAGTTSAGMAAGGFIVPNTQSSAVELYDGTSWTAGTSLNTARNGDANQGGGTAQTNVLVYGGTAPSSGKTESWDGTSWTEEGDMATNTNRFAGATANSSSGFAAGGAPTSPAAKGYSEEYNKSTNTVTAGAWGTGGAMNTARSLMGSFGTRTAAVGVAGLKNPYPTYSNDTEKYDGTSWTASGNYPQSIYSVGATGTSTAGLAFGGHLPGSSSNTTCEFDGSTWTAQGSPGNVPVSGGFSNGFGTQTAAIANLPGASTTIAYDGSSWTAFGSPGNMNTGRLDGYGQNGTSTAGLVVAGRTAPGPTNTTNTEEWDGSTWTAAGAYPVAMVFVQSNGTQTAAAGAGGDKMPGETSQTTTCTYDGSTWATAPNLGTAVSRQGGANSAPSTQGTIYSGNVPGITTTQEFTGETETTNITNFTTS